MGLLGGKTIVVSSTVYNMAGDEATRPDYLKNTIFGAVMSPHNPYLGEAIAYNLLNGPGMNQRQFYKWCVRQNYPGLPTFSVTSETSVDPTVVAGEIPTPGSPAGLVISMQSANLVSGSYEHIVEKYVLDNHPDRYDTAYVTSYDKITNDITIQWASPPGGSTVISAGTYDVTKSYIVAEYYHYLPASVGSLVTGGTTVGVLTKPSTTGYGLDASVNTGVVNYPMTFDTRVVTVYTGSEPPTLPVDTDVTTPDSDNPGFDGLDETWSKITYDGGDGNTEETISTEHFLEISEYRQIYSTTTTVSVVVNENTPVAGQTETITTTRIGEHIRPIYDWRIDTQPTTLLKMEGGVELFSYEIGTGNATLDALFATVSTTAEEAEYFPFLPIRINNNSITNTEYDDITGSGLYEKTNRAYRRASGGGQRFSRLVTEVEENPDINDIDYAFIHFGVSLNVIEPACRKYMYTWLKNASAHQTTSSSYMTGYSSLVATYLAEVADLNDWIFDQGLSSRPRYGDARPPTPLLASPEVTSVTLRPADEQCDHADQRTNFVNITETTGTGTLTNTETGLLAVAGEIWWTEGVDLEWEVVSGVYPNAITRNFKIERVHLGWQVDATNWKSLECWGLVHKNFVYGGEAVKLHAKEAINEVDPSGFIIPLHYNTMKDLGLKDSTQMATANTNIVFNSYEIVKQKWYQGFIGMLIIFIVMIVVTVIFAPAGGGVGILGANAAIGAAMGLTGTAAILAGAIVNALVAVAISQIISAGATAIFGAKWGAIIAAVVNLAITMGVAGGFDISSLSELATVENLLKFTSAIANGYEGYTQGAIAEIGAKMEDNLEEFNERMDKISKMLVELRGNSGLMFDPLKLTDSVRGNDASSSNGGYVTETLDVFIHRTTMTGSDIVDINLALINDFADLSLELPS